MIGYSAIEVFSPQLLAIHALAAAIVEQLPDKLDGEYVRCHEVARHVCDRLRTVVEQCDIVVVDGKYGVVDHSWLLLSRHTPSRLAILDVYSVSRVPMVTMLEQAFNLHHDYHHGPVRTDIRQLVLDALDSEYRGIVFPDPTMRAALAGRDPMEVRSEYVVREAITDKS